nr:prefoldin subunit 2 [Hymenolepis microstoma]
MTAAKEKNKPLTEEQIVEGFQKLRYEQRAIANKITGLEMDQREHNMVIKVLKGVDAERKCFRLIEGVLVERQVKHVLPALEANEKRMSEALEALRRQFDEKGVELQVYKEEHKIRLAGEDEGDDSHQSGGDAHKKSSDGEGADGKSSGASASSGVLVT